YGPIEVALPVHVATDLHGSAALLGTIWAIFGVGAVVGELSAPFLRRWPVWPVMTGIVLGWGLALVPFGLPGRLWAGLAAFTAARSSGGRGCRCPWACSRTPRRPARFPRSSRPAVRCSSWPRRSASLSAARSSPPSAPAAPC